MRETSLAVVSAPISWTFFPSARYKGGTLRSLPFIPLAFVAGVHGFPMFVSYVAVVLAVVQVTRLVRG
jgi:hypothetical protein